MGRFAGVWLLVGLVAFVGASGRVGNPWTTKASLKLQQQQGGAVAVDAEEPDVAGTDTLIDEVVVAGRFGDTPVNVETLKDFIKKRGVSDMGLINDLIVRASCIVRLEADLGEEVLTLASLSDYLNTRELPNEGSRDAMLDKACDYQEKERRVRKDLNKPVEDITKEGLKLELQRLGFINTSGSKSELVYRLGKGLGDIQTIRNNIDDQTFDSSEVKTLLHSRGLSTEGTTGMLLDRLAQHLVETSAVAGMPGINNQCNFVLSGSMCVYGGKKVIAPGGTPKGLVGRWTFDDAMGQDSSGLSHNTRTAPTHGTGLMGVGAAAKFDGHSYLEIPHSEHFASQDFCVTFWTYLLQDPTGVWRSLIHKGNQDHERTPTLFMEPMTRGIEFFVSTTDASQPAGERLWSNTFIPLRKWTHIAACAEGRNMRLYINGMLDAENTTIGTPVLNNGPMYVGGDPWRVGDGVASHVDELRYYSRALHADEIQAQASHSIGGVESPFVELGCMACSLDACPKSCRRGFRMCTERDLYGGAYAVGRSLGWANSETRIWREEDSQDAADTIDAAGLCMCCREEA